MTKFWIKISVKICRLVGQMGVEPDECSWKQGTQLIFYNRFSTAYVRFNAHLTNQSMHFDTDFGPQFWHLILESFLKEILLTKNEISWMVCYQNFLLISVPIIVAENKLIFFLDRLCYKHYVPAGLPYFVRLSVCHDKD